MDKDTVVLPITLRGDLLQLFSMYYREIEAIDAEATPSSVVEYLLLAILQDDMEAERPCRMN